MMTWFQVTCPKCTGALQVRLPEVQELFGRYANWGLGHERMSLEDLRTFWRHEQGGGADAEQEEALIGWGALNCCSCFAAVLPKPLRECDTDAVFGGAAGKMMGQLIIGDGLSKHLS